MFELSWLTDFIVRSPLISPPFRSDTIYSLSTIKSLNDEVIFLGTVEETVNGKKRVISRGDRCSGNLIFEHRKSKPLKVSLELLPDPTGFVPSDDFRIAARHDIASLVKPNHPDVSKAHFIRLINFNHFLESVRSQEEFNAAMLKVEHEIRSLIVDHQPTFRWKNQRNQLDIEGWKRFFSTLFV